MGNGPLGTDTNPGPIDSGTNARTLMRSPRSLCVTNLSPTEIEHYAMQAAHRLDMATSWIDTRTAIGSYLGGQSFSAGVVAGMVGNLATTCYELIKFFKMFALAEYYEAKYAQGTWERIKHAMNFTSFPGMAMAGSMLVASTFWPDFDRKAKEAHEDKEALIQTVIYSFGHPGEVFANISAEQKKKYEEFLGYTKRHTMVGDFQAGRLFGELLFDVLMIIDGVTALARLATKIPGLLRLLPKIRELIPAVRSAARSGGGALARDGADAATAARSGKIYDRINPTGRPEPVEPKSLPEPKEKPKPPPKKPSYRIGASDGGPGEWGENPRGYPKKAADAAYQQATTGAPANIEYKVPTNRIKSGEKWFDGYDPASDRLLESKNYTDWPKEDLKFSMDQVTEEMRTSDEIAGDLGKTVEYRVASPDKAAILRDIAEKNSFDNIVVTHSAGI